MALILAAQTYPFPLRNEISKWQNQNFLNCTINWLTPGWHQLPTAFSGEMGWQGEAIGILLKFKGTTQRKVETKTHNHSDKRRTGVNFDEAAG